MPLCVRRIGYMHQNSNSVLVICAMFVFLVGILEQIMTKSPFEMNLSYEGKTSGYGKIKVSL